MIEINTKITLTKTMHKEGFTFLMHWGGGVSLAKVRDEQDNIIKTEKVSKSVQSYHHVSPVTLAHYLSTPTTNYFDKRNWSKMTESARITAHLNDRVHDESFRGCTGWSMV